jgi:arylsulfatase A-like enzyme
MAGFREFPWEVIKKVTVQNILLISVDSLRPEALGYYPQRFKSRETFPWRVSTPTIDHLAREGVFFTNCIVQAPFTPASHASFLTGLNPPSHRLRAFFGYKLLEQVEALPERLKREGYSTAAFLGADALNETYGLDRGFDVYDTDFKSRMDIWVQGQYRRLGSEATDRALNWLEGAQEPFLLFIHYFDAHQIAAHILAKHDRVAAITHGMSRNRLARGPVRRLLLKVDALYGRQERCGKPFHVRQVRKIDGEIARIVQALKERNLYGRTMIVIISDHGEAFGEHGETGHRLYLYDTTLRVPLILTSIPNYRGKVISAMVRSIDLVPTLYEALGLNHNASPGRIPIEGTSLLPLIDGEDSGDRVAYSETRMEKSLENIDDLRGHYVALRTSRWKLIVNMLDGSQELYNLIHDPGENCNLIARRPDVAKYLFQEAMRICTRGGKEDLRHQAYDKEEREELERRLKDLGYF